MIVASPPFSTPALPQRLEDGTEVGRYEIDGWLRDGGMASLYRGHHVKTGAKVAIKVQNGRGPEELVTAARFDREAQLMGRLSGVPNVAQVHDVGELPDGRRYLVMEWIAGENLEELLDDLRNDDRRLEVERACRLLKDVAHALAAVHRAEVVHRDLKPSNIMIDRGLGDREVAKLVDFGISADLGGGGGSADLTAAGVVLGTSGYVSPEQALGLPAHPSFDVYAFGVVLFEALTGYGAPREGLVPERLPSIITQRIRVPPELVELVVACLQRDPRKRPPGAEALVERLDAVIRGVRRAARSKAPALVARVGTGMEGAEGAEDEPGSRAPVRDERAPPEPKHGEIETGEAQAKEVTQRHERVRGPKTWAMATAVVVAIAVLGLGWVALLHGWLGGDEGYGGAARVDEDAGTPTATPVGTGDSVVVDTAQSAETLERATGSTTESPSGSDEPDLEPSSTGHGPDLPSTSNGRAPNGPKGPVESVTSQACAGARRRAQDAATKGRDWTAVLRATSTRRCWDAAEYRDERRALRVEALLELRRFAECVKEGAGSTDPRVARGTKLCRLRTEKEPG